MDQGTDDNLIGVRIGDYQTGSGQISATRISDSVNDAAREPNRERFKRLGVQQLLDVFVVHGNSAENTSGAGGARTPDLLNAIQARSQLRHSPIVAPSATDLD
jgi:hypothetical protein